MPVQINNMSKVLFYSPIMEHPAVGGPQLRIENSVKVLSGICDLYVINGDSSATSETHVFYQKYTKNYYAIRTGSYSDLKGNISVTLEKVLNKIFKTRLRSQAKLITNWAEIHKINLIWIGYGNISYPLIKRLKKLAPNIRLVCDTDSVWSRFIIREIPHISGFAKFITYYYALKKRREERAWVNLCDVTTAVSEIDARYYRALTIKSSSIHIFANVIDKSSYSYRLSASQDLITPALYLAGSFGKPESSMNLAARWVISEIFPLVQKRVPRCHLYIVGNNSDIEFGGIKNSSITVTGRVDTVLPYLIGASVALVPLKFESGTRFKILEAGICRLPVVSTTLGAEGLNVKNGVNILIADTNTEFAEAIISLLENRTKANLIAENLYKVIESNYGLEVLKLQAGEIFKYLNMKIAG
jgi:glycosyltransferase involved in cell wall biosynthesis